MMRCILASGLSIAETDFREKKLYVSYPSMSTPISWGNEKINVPFFYTSAIYFGVFNIFFGDTNTANH